jgi:Polyketide synthase dehydratase
MATEAIYQMSRSTYRTEETTEVYNVSYRLRNINFARALVLDDGTDHKIFLSLTPCMGSKDSWHEFKISSLREDLWTEHCRGLICLLLEEEEGEYSIQTV